MKKKLLGTALAACLLVPSVFGLAGCDKGSDRTMNVSINPSLSFVVNGNDKVVNVVYENEDAGQIYANIDFVGMKADDAVETLIERATISGYYSFDGQKVTVSVNGSNQKDIESLENLAKKEIEATYADFGITVTVNVEELTEAARKQALVAKATILAPEKSAEELNAMTEKELVELIKTKQEELKGLAYDQVEQIKGTFGKAENAVLQEIATVRENLAKAKTDLADKEAQLANYPDLQASLQPLIDGFKTTIKELDKKIETLVEQYLQAKKQAIETAKEVYNTHKQALVDLYKTKLLEVENSIQAYMTSTESTLTQAQKDYWQSVINKAKTEVNA